MSADQEKRRWPRAEALAVAEHLAGGLRAERLAIAGSIRREKLSVGDIELVYIPLIQETTNPDSLFGEPVMGNRTDACIAELEKQGVLERRKNVKGTEMFGEKNKLMVHVASGIPVDLFSTSEEAWFNYLVCRTGGAESNKAVCNAAIARGWKWAPYGIGFVRPGQAPLVVRAERDVFEFVGLPYLEPRERK